MSQNSILKALSQAGVRLPAAVIDLDAFDENVSAVAASVAGADLTIRIATKSLRVPELIRRASAGAIAGSGATASGAPSSGATAYRGYMCYSGFEAAFLASQGLDDLLIAYPTLQPSELKVILELFRSGKNVSLVVDDIRQVEAIERVSQSMGGLAGSGSLPGASGSAGRSGSGGMFNSGGLPVIVEYDMALRLGPLVIGVRRSPLRSADEIISFIKKLNAMPSVRFSGIMAYEAQVAGVGDKNPFKPLLSWPLRFIRRFSAAKVARQRKELVHRLRASGISFSIFNGGGTGSLSFNRGESGVLTEVTAGSGFFCSHLFDYYTNFSLKPAAYFAAQVTRQSGSDWYACQGGGYIASGEPGWDRVPKPVSELKLSGFEGTGEVQTPIQSSAPLELGSAVLFRPAKAGEWLERFNEVHLFSRGKIIGTAKTYRGFGECYY